MKIKNICDLDKLDVCLNKNGNLKAKIGLKKRTVYYYEKCLNCNSAYISTRKGAKFCGADCARYKDINKKDEYLKNKKVLKRKTYRSKIKCKICSRKFISYVALSQHIIQTHKISTKEYYDKYIDLEAHLCNDCKIKECCFININKGYSNLCRRCNGKLLGLSYHCNGIINIETEIRSRTAKNNWKKIKKDKKKFNEFRIKCKKNAEKFWNSVDENTKKEIAKKSSEKLKKINSKLTKEERKEKYGWLNKLSDKEKERFINDNLEKSLFKWHKDSSEQDKKDVIEKIRKTKLGERYNDREVMKSFLSYKERVRYLTEKTYKKYKNIINPNNYRRSKNKYQLDHKFSIIAGFNSKIEPKIMSCLYNLQMLTAKENNSKNTNCSITKEDLIKGYYEYEKQF